MRSKLGDKVRLQHILEAIQEIESYLADVEFEKFLENSMMRFACIKQMEIIGEASNHVSDEVKSEFSSVEWAQIIGMRNVFVHEYFGVDDTIVWEIIRKDIPVLKAKIEEILVRINQ
jgi:uncharacterized protein with HEPN domain